MTSKRVDFNDVPTLEIGDIQATVLRPRPSFPTSEFPDASCCYSLSCKVTAAIDPNLKELGTIGSFP